MKTKLIQISLGLSVDCRKTIEAVVVECEKIRGFQINKNPFYLSVSKLQIWFLEQLERVN